MGRRNFQMIEQRDDVVGHLLDRIDLLGCHGPAAAARVVQDQVRRLGKRQLRRLPRFRGKAGRWNQHQRFAAAVSFEIEIGSRW